MIGHTVTIGGEDVSDEVISINVEQSIETDSDPGKITIVLANRHQKYTDHFVPQVSRIFVDLHNYSYKNNPKTFRICDGKVTDTKCPIEEITIKGECDLGHLADYLPKEFDFKWTTPLQVLSEVLATHDEPIFLDWDDKLKKPNIGPVTFDSQYTYQAVLEDMRQIVGAVYYFDERNKLKFRDPTSLTSYYDLDPYLSKPTQAQSILGFCNYVDIIAYDSLENDEEGFPTAKHTPIIAHAEDDETDYSVKKIGRIIAASRFEYNIHNQDEAQEAADQLLEFYKARKDALTEIVVEGMAPALQSLVKYTSFVPIDGSKAPVTIYGMVLEKKVEYSADGFSTTLTLHPRTEFADVVADLAEATE